MSSRTLIDSWCAIKLVLTFSDRCTDLLEDDLSFIWIFWSSNIAFVIETIHLVEHSQLLFPISQHYELPKKTRYLKNVPKCGSLSLIICALISNSGLSCATICFFSNTKVQQLYPSCLWLFYVLMSWAVNGRIFWLTVTNSTPFQLTGI